MGDRKNERKEKGDEKGQHSEARKKRKMVVVLQYEIADDSGACIGAGDRISCNEWF